MRGERLKAAGTIEVHFKKVTVLANGESLTVTQGMLSVDEELEKLVRGFVEVLKQ